MRIDVLCFGRMSLAVLLALTPAKALSQRYLDRAGYQLVLDEQFNYNSIYDSAMAARWQYESHHKYWTGGIELFSPTQLEIRKDHTGNSILSIHAALLDTPRLYGNKLKYYKSGMINYKVARETNCTRLHWMTEPAVGFTYGIFEIRAKIPAGNKQSWDAWPAFWLTSFPVGEIDIIDAICANPGSKLHSGCINWAQFPGAGANGWKVINPDSQKPPGKHRKRQNKINTFSADVDYRQSDIVSYEGKTYRAEQPMPAPVLSSDDNDPYTDLSLDFHVYTVVWTPEALSFFLDEKELVTKRFTKAVDMYDCPMRLLVNLSVMGKGDGTPSDNAATEMQMDVDYIRVYQAKNGNAAEYMYLPAYTLPLYGSE